MVGITYGIYLIFQVVQYDTPLYFHNETSRILEDNQIGHFRKLTFIDIVSIGLILYLSTLEFIWGWKFVSGNWLVIIDMIISTVVWLGILLWIFLYFL